MPLAHSSGYFSDYFLPFLPPYSELFRNFSSQIDIQSIAMLRNIKGKSC